MASLSKDKNGNRTIQFVAGDRKRRSIRLGKMPAKSAATVKAKVEALNASSISGTSWDAETAAWVGKLGEVLYDKLASVGLLPKRKARENSTLGVFLASYIKGRSDVKGGTAIMYGQVQRGLIDYFGATRPISEVTPADTDDWRRWLASGETAPDGQVIRKKLADNTVRRRCGIARQFFRMAVRRRLIAENPFAEMTSVAVRANRLRDYFLSREDAARVLDACPDAQWRLLFALSRYGGLRCPSEHLTLRWGDVDLVANRFTVRSPKTEHIDGCESREVPIFPELRPYFEDAIALAGDEAIDPTAFVITRYRTPGVNLRTQLERIIARAGLKPWPKLFQNLRATRETELAEKFPIHVVCKWIGNSQAVAAKHYLQTTDEHFSEAAKPADASPVQIPVQSAADTAGPAETNRPADLVLSSGDRACPRWTEVQVVREGFEPPTKGL